MLVLLDLKLPRVGGLEVLKRIRAAEPTQRVPVVILTSSGEDRELIDGYDLGANSYVRKPIRFEQFATAVAQLWIYWPMINEPPPIADNNTEQTESDFKSPVADADS